MKALRHILSLTLIFLAAAGSNVSAQSFTWGGSATFTSSQQTYYDSFGDPLLTNNNASAPTFSIGYFNAGFTPTIRNIGSWSANFTIIASSTLESTIPWSFGGQDDVASAASDGLHPYLFVYDALGQTGNLGGQVFLGGWLDQTLPTFGSSTPPPTFDFSNMTDLIAGAVDKNFSTQGAGGVVSATGYINLNQSLQIQAPMADNSFEAQLARVSGPVPVPEPSGAALILAAFGILLHSRRRSA